MDELRIGSPGNIDSLAGQTRDGAKKRPRQKHVEPEEEPMDEVILHSAGEAEDEQPLGYQPTSSDE
jgi:hypothetical protein